MFSSTACLSGKFGTKCNQICTCNTQNTLSCNTVNGTCTCKEGWKGPTCDVDINECAVPSSGLCPVHSHCMNINGSYVCPCEAGYSKTSDGKCEGSTYANIIFNCILKIPRPGQKKNNKMAK